MDNFVKKTYPIVEEAQVTIPLMKMDLFIAKIVHMSML